MSARTRRRGFTLIEVLAVLLLTSLVMGVAIDFYRDLSQASSEAVVRARNARRAVVLLDRVARDLEAAVLLKKPGAVDPLYHPWIFLAEADDPDLGAQRLKFVSRGRRPRSPETAESDLQMVAWMLEPSDRNDFELRRWSSPQLPESRDLSFPSRDDSEPVAGRIASFGVFLIGEDGAPVARWDSSALVESSELPHSAEIQVSFYTDDDTDEIDGPYVRRVTLPLRALDIEQQLEAAGVLVAGRDADGDGVPDDEQDPDGEGPAEDGAGSADGGGGMTVDQCIAANQDVFAAALNLYPGLRDVAEGFRGRPVSEVAGLLGSAMGIPLPANCQ
jgi:prepilin-type N-terminal cleavage/methylation domain-containing protein